GPGRFVSFRLPSPRGPARRRAANVGRAPAPARPAYARRHSCPAGQGRESGAGTSVIVVDASALLEVLLNTSAGERIAARLAAAARPSTCRTSWTWKSPRCCDATQPRERSTRDAGCRL